MPKAPAQAEIHFHKIDFRAFPPLFSLAQTAQPLFAPTVQISELEGAKKLKDVREISNGIRFVPDGIRDREWRWADVAKPHFRNLKPTGVWSSD